MPVPVTISLAELTTYPTMGHGSAGLFFAEQTQASIFKIGTDLWAAGRNEDSFPFGARLYKSMDAGATWADMDSVNAPTISSYREIACQALGSIIYVLYQAPDGSGGTTGLRVKSFDTGTGLWGGETADVPDTTGGQASDVFGLHVTAADTFNVIYGGFVSAVYQVMLIQYTAGSWGSAAPITADLPDSIITSFFVDPVANVAHVTYSKRQSFSPPLIPNTVRYLTVAADGTVAASTLAIADAPEFVATNFNFTYPSFGYGCVMGGMIFLPFARRTSVGVIQPAILVFSSGAWAVTNLSNPAADIIDGPAGAWTTAVVSGGTVYVLWAHADEGTPVNQIRMAQTTDGVTFTAPVTLYDLAVDPPLNSDPGGPIYDISATVIGAGSIGATVSIPGETIDHWSLRRYVELSVAGPPLTLDCDSPPGGQVSEPYTHAFPAAGGVPPYTFAITVGDLPDGLTLDSATGIVSGTPTLAGTFPFTIQVTDADDTTASVDCSITIHAPLSGGCGSPPAATVGEAYTHTFPAEGGIPPYTFSITAGALPDGLTLDSATGVVSGTPLMVQDSTYTITVTDSEDTSVSSICSTPSGEPPVQICLDSVTDNAQDTTTPGKCCTMRLSRATQGWWPMEWPVTPVTSVYSEVTPQTVTPRLLMTTNHSSILNTTPTNSDDDQPIVAYVRTPSIDGGDSRAQKLYVDVMNDLVNNSLVLATVGFNNYTFIYPQFNIPPNGVRTLWRLKISTLQTTLALWRNIAVEYRFSPGTRLYECQPASYLQPYVACHFISRGDHGFPDWQCLRDGLFALISTAPVTLTIDIDGIQTLSPYTLASTSGDLRKVYQLLRHASKGRMFIWQLQSTEPFALFTEETIVRIKSWTGDFIDTKPFSGALPSS